MARIVALTKIDQLNQEIEALRARSSSLHAAILRINASLDVDTVLNEVVESARELTGARCGVIVTVDNSGRPEDSLASGFTPAQLQKIYDWPHGEGLFKHLNHIEAPFRVADFRDWIRSVGFDPVSLAPPNTLQATPIRHRDKHLGTFFLGDKQGGGPFTDEDEEVLVLFASQAAAAISNARTYQDEQRAHADLEALVETSPVGVVVFDAETGQPVSINREAHRIVSGLHIDGQPPEHLLEVMICHYPDGREVALSEYPLARMFRNALPVRAEHIELSVPDGRRVSMLINATPIRSSSGEVVSLVVTMQDLASLRELEHLRAEFLHLVSHELRAPLISIKGSTTTALGSSRPIESGEVRQFFKIIDEQANHMHELIGDLLDAGRIEAGTLSVSPEPVQLITLVDRARNTFVSGGGRHTLQIDLPTNLPPVMADEGRIVQVFNNLLANAAGYSSPTTPIRIEAVQRGIHVEVSVTDEGKGITPEQMPYLFLKYAGMAGDDADRDTAGYGLGLAICKGLVEAHGGRIRAASAGKGQGSRFTFTLPLAAIDEEEHIPTSRDHPNEFGDTTRILVLDDDPQMLQYLHDMLSEVGYSTVLTGDPDELPDLVRKKRPHLVLLDLMFPKIDGIELMTSVKALAELPVIFISVYGRDETIARALSAGAVDYIVKPFSPTELTARIQAALRSLARPAKYVLGNLSIDYSRRLVTLADQALELTATEYELLRTLSLNAGAVVTHETLLELVWGGRHTNNENQNVVRTYVRRLRHKLGDDAEKPSYIFTQFRVGYRMPDPSPL